MSRRAQRLVSGKPPKASQRRNARKESAKVRKAEAQKPKAPRMTARRTHLMAYSPSAATPGTRRPLRAPWGPLRRCAGGCAQ
jgi:hypothetical protein